MAHIARIIAPDMPHYLMQRGNRSLPTFLCDDDYALSVIAERLVRPLTCGYLGVLSDAESRTSYRRT